MAAEFIPALPFLIALYPEIHYRFRFFPFSRYWQRAPEIIADAPRRLEPGSPLPLLLLVKCAHRFPLKLKSIEIEATTRDRVVRRSISINVSISEPFWYRIEPLDLPDEAPAVWQVQVMWHVEITGQSHIIQNDNMPGLSHLPLTVIQSGQALPRAEGLRLGDLHVHTAYTEDQVEFGAPLEAYPELGAVQGFSFAFAADHAYDLDDQPGSWIRADEQLRRFRQRSDQIQALNHQYRGRFALLPGFEHSAGNVRGRNVHLLLVGQTDFLPGSGDSAERWLHTKTELTLREVLEQCGDRVLPIAAHPMVEPSVLEKLLLRRGRWEEEDLGIKIPPDPLFLRGGKKELFGLQVWNGRQTQDFQAGIRCWVQGLLQGKRWKIVAGSDAHGNFSRYRQVGFPMLRLTETDDHVFGCAWTGVRCEAGAGPEGLIAALREDRSYVSDGPFADLEIIRGTTGSRLKAQVFSSPEFGAPDQVVVYQGIWGEARERELLRSKERGNYTWEKEIPLPVAEGYVRLEVVTTEGRRCLTNPAWLNVPG